MFYYLTLAGEHVQHFSVFISDWHCCQFIIKIQLNDWCDDTLDTSEQKSVWRFTPVTDTLDQILELHVFLQIRHFLLTDCVQELNMSLVWNAWCLSDNVLCLSMYFQSKTFKLAQVTSSYSLAESEKIIYQNGILLYISVVQTHEATGTSVSLNRQTDD